MQTILFSIFLVIIHAAAAHSQAIDIKDIPNLIVRSAEAGRGITQNEQKIAEEILHCGAPAIPYLLPLLKHQNTDVRDLSSYILRDIDGLKEEHLEPLMESRLRGDGWIPPAIARIGTPKAIRFLVEELKKEKEQETQLTWAFEKLGEKGIPYLVELYQNPGEFDADLFKTVNFILGKLKDKAEAAVDPLMVVVSDNTIDKNIKVWAVDGLGQIGPKAQRSAPLLQKLASDDPLTFGKIVEKAVIHTGSPEAVNYLLKRLDENPKVTVFRDIAQMGVNGQTAGASLTAYLNNKDWDTRIWAARALGYIGYKQAVPDLIGILDKDDDWMLTCVAAESLGRLDAKEAISSFNNISKTHWYPPVRNAALKAIRVINGDDKYNPVPEDEKEFASHFYAIDVKYGEAEPSNKSINKNEIADEPDGVETAKLEELTYEKETKYYDVDGVHIVMKKQVPGVGLKIENGYLVGSDHGEWGGELVYIDLKGGQKLLVSTNVKGIYRMPFGILVVTGLSHGTVNRGIIFMVAKDSGGIWNAHPWKALPGAPKISALLKNGGLIVRCNGGDVVISPGGKISMLK